LYKSAIELDPNFALAYTQLARAHSRIYWFGYDRSEEQLAKTKQAVDKAFELDPDLPEAHLALGQYYYHCLQDYDRALEHFDIARKGRPYDGEPLSMICFVKRQQGKYDEALDSIKKAYELNPLSNSIASEAGTTCFHMHKYQEAEYYYQKAISIAPDMYNNYFFKAKLYLSWQGNTKKARTALEEAMKKARGAEYPFIVNLLVNIEIYDENYQEALNLLSLWPSDSFDAHFFFIPKALLQAQINGLLGNDQFEQSYYEKARSILEPKITEQPEDLRFHSSLGVAYAGLGLKEEAIREGKQGRSTKNLAYIYSMVCEYELAMDMLEYLLSKPGEFSIPLIRLDPAWDPLRNHPRFQKLIESEK
jgi:serine/threonine-protein kinase